MNTTINVKALLERRINRHGLKPTQEQFDDLFRDFMELWQQAEAEAVNPRVSKLCLLDGLDEFFRRQVAKQND